MAFACEQNQTFFQFINYFSFFSGLGATLFFTLHAIAVVSSIFMMKKESPMKTSQTPYNGVAYSTCAVPIEKEIPELNFEKNAKTETKNTLSSTHQMQL